MPLKMNKNDNSNKYDDIHVNKHTRKKNIYNKDSHK